MNRFKLAQGEVTSDRLSANWHNYRASDLSSQWIISTNSCIRKALEPARPRAVLAAGALKAAPNTTRQDIGRSTPTELTAAFET